MTLNTYTDTIICNTALDLVGAESINSLEENSDVGAVCSRAFPSRRDALLARGSWRWAKGKRELNKAADFTPLNIHKNAHRLPADLIEGPTAVYGDGSSRPVAGWEQYGVYIYSDYDVMIIDYLRRPPVEQWPYYFVNLLIHDLAAGFALSIKENTSRHEALLKLAYGTPGYDGQGGLYAEARRIHSQSSPIKSLHKNGNRLLATRY